MVPAQSAGCLHDGRYCRKKQGKVKNDVIKNICNWLGYLPTFWCESEKGSESVRKKGSHGQ
jgi:hypothetical protein